uniref:ATP synthase complex subunit 8 n=1 Tax=Serranus baldwini TaxID=184441 RepID=Q7Y660_9TELE|nr:ATPase 8 [Serranus baldwini]AAP92018.1 ATPase 8 [Serranus baldwini]WNH21911.1 ATP synthase F0 subunit 8 [Serranus baldwini]
MPQLNPSPWFAIMVFSWMVFLTVIPPKIMSHTFLNEPSSRSAKKSDQNNWSWPWP